MLPDSRSTAVRQTVFLQLAVRLIRHSHFYEASRHQWPDVPLECASIAAYPYFLKISLRESVPSSSAFSIFLCVTVSSTGRFSSCLSWCCACSMMLFKTAESGRVSVMESKLRDQKRIVLDAIDDTVFSGNPARPKTGQSMLQGDFLSTGLSIC